MNTCMQKSMKTRHLFEKEQGGEYWRVWSEESEGGK